MKQPWWYKHYLKHGWVEWTEAEPPDPSLYRIEVVDTGIPEYNPGHKSGRLVLGMFIALLIPVVFLMWLTIVSWQAVMIVYFLTIALILRAIARR